MNKLKLYFVVICLIFSVPVVKSQVQIKLPAQKFEVPSVPAELQDESEINIWLVNHYWDKFNFTDTENLKDQQLVFPITSSYITLLNKVPADIAVSSLNELLRNSKANIDVYKYFANTLNDLLGNTVSPYRNDEYLIVVLEDLLSDNNLSEEDESRYTMNLSMAMKNRIGTVATNFGYIDTSNKNDSLYNIKAEITMLMFYAPGCHACESAEREIESSEMINNWIESGDLKILAFAPETSVEDWKSFQNSLPSTWINAYDPQQTVWLKRLYDIQGFPTIYLLDKDKKVLLKDTNIRTVENYLMEQAMTLSGM